MEYGDKRDYPKIDIYVNGEYRVSTTWSATCREARKRFTQTYNIPLDKVVARFSK